MVVKISSGSNIAGLLAYNEDKVSVGEASVIYANNIFGLFDESYSDIRYKDKADSFNYNIRNNKRTENYTFHVSLNPDPSDELSDKQFQDLARDYMTEMGYAAQPYLVYLHKDIDRAHIHIVSVRVDSTGKKLDSNFERVKSNRIRKQLEEKYNLTPAEEKRLTAKQKYERNMRVAVDSIESHNVLSEPYSASNIVKKIRRGVKHAATYNVASFKDYKAVLKQFNIGFEIIEGEAGEAKYRGIVYFALENGERAGMAIKSSLLGKDFGVKFLEDRFESTKKQQKDKSTRQYSYRLYSESLIKKKIISVLKKYDTLSISDFTRNLSLVGITVDLHINGDGRIYGVTFTDNISKSVFKGSELGKEFSANSLNERLEAGSSVLKTDVNTILSQISTIYNQKRKESGIFYESDFIPKLEGLRGAIAKILLSQNPEINIRTINKAIEQYAEFKNNKLSDIRGKEISYFSDYATSMYHYSLSLNKDVRLEFLEKCGVLPRRDIKSGNVRLVSSRGDSVYTVSDQQYSNTDFPGEFTRGKAFNKQEINIFKSLANGTLPDTLKKCNFQFVRDKAQFLQYMSDSNKRVVVKKMNGDVITSFFKDCKGFSIEDILKQGLMRGIIFTPTKQGYTVNSYNLTQDYSFAVNKETKDLLDKANYTGRYSSVKNFVYDKSVVSLQYKLFVGLVQADSIKDEARTDKIISFVEKINKDLYLQMKDVTGEGRGEKLITLIAEYPEQSLRKPYSNHHKKQSRNSSLFNFRIRFIKEKDIKHKHRKL